MWAGWWAVRSALAEGGPEGGLGADNRFNGGLDGSSRLGRCDWVDAGDVTLRQGSPEGSVARDHRLHSGDARRHGGGLAAHQLDGQGANDEGSEEASGQGDRAATSGNDAVGQNSKLTCYFSMEKIGVDRY